MLLGGDCLFASTCLECYWMEIVCLLLHACLKGLNTSLKKNFTYTMFWLLIPPTLRLSKAVRWSYFFESNGQLCKNKSKNMKSYIVERFKVITSECYDYVTVNTYNLQVIKETWQLVYQVDPMHAFLITWLRPTTITKSRIFLLF